MHHRTLSWLATVLLLWAASYCGLTIAEDVDNYDAEIVLIVHPKNSTEQLSRREVIEIFMGRYRIFPNGLMAIPVDADETRAIFYSLLIQKPLSEINAYWAQLVFSGGKSPPQRVNNCSDVLSIVSNNVNSIGYVYRKDLTPDVKPVANLTTFSDDGRAR